MFGALPNVRIGTRSAVLLVAWLHGIVVAVVLFRRAWQRRVTADAVLAGVLLACCGDLTSHVIGWAGAYDRWPDLSFFPFGSAFAVGPLVWYHIRSLTEGSFRWRASDAVHAIPFFLEKLLYLWIWQHPLAWKNLFDGAWQVPVIGPVRAVLSAVVTGVYLWLALQRYRAYRRWVDDSQSDAGLRLEWLERVLYVSVAGFSLKLGFDLLAAFRDLGFAGWFIYNFLLACLTYYLSVAGLIYLPTPAPADAPTIRATGADESADAHDAVGAQRLLPVPHGRDTSALPDIDPDGTPLSPRVDMSTGQLYADAAPSDVPDRDHGAAALAKRQDDRLVERLARLNHLMTDERPWLNPRLTLTDLARELNSNPSAISSLINEGTGLNFNDYVNGFRVRAVQDIIVTREEADDSLLALALGCGFNAKTTFNRSFRKITGMSPTQFAAQARSAEATDVVRRTRSSRSSDS